MLSEYTLIGEVLRPQGIKGEVKVRPDTDDADRYLDLESVFAKREKDTGYTVMSVDSARVQADGVYLRLNGAQDRNEAEKQRGLFLYVDREHAVQLGEDSNFICDLIGCEVYGDKGTYIGKVIDVLQPGANDVYVLSTPRGEVLVPALKKVFPVTDVENRRMIADESVYPQVAVLQD